MQRLSRLGKDRGVNFKLSEFSLVWVSDLFARLSVSDSDDGLSAHLHCPPYRNMDHKTKIVTGLAIMMTGALVFGILQRKKHGSTGTGFEDVAILALYLSEMPVILG